MSLVSDDGSSAEKLSKSASEVATTACEISEGQVEDMSAEQASKAAFVAQGKALEAILKRPDFSFVTNEQGSTLLHLMGASVPNALMLLQRANSSLLLAKNRDGDTPLSALCKRASTLKKESRFVELVLAMIKACPESLGLMIE